MKSILFLDDWMLDARDNIARRFIQPTPVARELTFANTFPARPFGGYANVIRDPETGRFQTWYEAPGTRPLPGGNFTGTLCYAESDDGFHFTAPDLGFAEKLGVDPRLKNAVDYDLPPIAASKVVYDPVDPDRARRYKLPATTDGEGTPRFSLYTSPDGIHWQILPGSCWYPDDLSRRGSDCDNNLLYNPITGRYQMICRWACLDRRVAITESDDLVHWTEPQVILYPDALDEPLIQFYSMAQFWYKEMFIGIMQRQHTATTEHDAVKWLGKVDNELVYSVNGLHWNRTHRERFTPRPPLGEPGSETLYTNSMVELPDGILRFYSNGNVVEHFAHTPPEDARSDIHILAHELRPAGFACLEPVSGYGLFATRQILPRNSDLKINVLAPNGVVRVQVSDRYFKPIDGLTYDDCNPITGDHIAAPVTWNSGKNLAELIDQGIRLEFKLFQAQVYAIDWDFRICYGDPVIERI